MNTAMLILALASGEPPAAVLALQDELRSTIEKVEPGVVAIVVSTNPAYSAPQGKAKPGTLGGYFSGETTDGIVPRQRDKLDLSDTRNAADNTFGSGLVIDRNGLILTTWHLIDGAKKIYVRLKVRGKDNREVVLGSYADIHAADARADLAVLKLITPIERMTPIKFARVTTHDEPDRKASVYRGQFVVAMAHPFAAGFHDGAASAATGIISNIRRRASNDGSEESRQTVLANYSNLLQTDARLSLGSSGGALFNLNGEALGLLTATAAVTGSEASGGYAIPFDGIYRRIIDTLAEGREVEYGFLGMSTKGMGAHGLIVDNVSPNTPARAAGLHNDDVIVSVDGRPLREREDLFLLVGGSLAGREVALEVLRGTEKLVLKPRLAKFAHAYPKIVSEPVEPVFGLRVDYTSILAQQPMLVGERRAITPGVIIRELEPDSPAMKLEPHKSMIITRVNEEPVTTPAEFIRAARGQKRITLTLAGAHDPDNQRLVSLP